jgi:succinylglutamate desuccinylase
MHTAVRHGKHKSFAQVPQIPEENSDGNFLVQAEPRVSILSFQAQQQGVRL